MRSVFFGLAMAFAVFFTGADKVAAQEADIQGVISSQIDALKVDDFVTAFTFAAPTIQDIFRTPENFGRMVSQGYPMVWRPAEVEYLELDRKGSVALQTVRIVDGEGRVHLLEYSMTEIEGGWKISGVRILQASGVTA